MPDRKPLYAMLLVALFLLGTLLVSAILFKYEGPDKSALIGQVITFLVFVGGVLVTNLQLKDVHAVVNGQTKELAEQKAIISRAEGKEEGAAQAKAQEAALPAQIATAAAQAAATAASAQATAATTIRDATTVAQQILAETQAHAQKMLTDAAATVAAMLLEAKKAKDGTSDKPQ